MSKSEADRQQPRWRSWRLFGGRRTSAVPDRPTLLPGYAGGQGNWWLAHSRSLYVALAIVAFIYGMAFGLMGTLVLLTLLMPLGVLVALSIWLLPDTRTPPTDALYRLTMAFLVAFLLWPNYIALALPGMPWITALRLTSTPLLLIMLICLSVSQNFRRELAEILGALPLLWKLVVAFAILGLLSIALSGDPSLSFNKFFVAQTTWTLLFFACAFVFAKPGRANFFCYFLWICGIVICVTGLIEARNQALPWAGRIPSFLKVDEQTLASVFSAKARKATGMYRAKAMQTTPLGLAEILALIAPFVVHIIFTARNRAVQVAAALTLPLIFRTLVQTDSRLGMVGFLMTMMLYLLAWGALRWSRDRTSVAGPLVVMTYPAIFVAFVTATFFVRRLRVMVWGGGATQASSDAREAQIAKGIPMVFSHPWGYGIGRSGAVLGWTNQMGMASIDTYWLAIALEYGVFGFILYYGLFGYAAVTAGIQSLKAADAETGMLMPAAIALANFVIIKSVFAQEANHPLVFVFLGLIVALVFRVKRDPRSLPLPWRTRTEDARSGTRPALPALAARRA